MYANVNNKSLIDDVFVCKTCMLHSSAAAWFIPAIILRLAVHNVCVGECECESETAVVCALVYCCMGLLFTDKLAPSCQISPL